MASHPYLEEQFNTLSSRSSLAKYNLEGGYAIVPKVHKSWDAAERRILFVLESMDHADLRAGSMFTPAASKEGNKGEQNLMIATMRNTLRQSWSLFQEYLGKNSISEAPAAPDFAVGFVNFNATKYFHLKDTQRMNVLVKCAARVRSIVQDLKPTHVVVLGDTASYHLIQDDMKDTLAWRRGWVIDTKIGDHPCLVTPTLDIEPLYNGGNDGESDDDDAGEADSSGSADLLYYVCRNLCNAYAGKMLHSVAHVRPKIRLVDSIEAFDAFYAKLLASPQEVPIGYDIESENLEAYSNKIYTFQFAFTERSAYLIPFEHPSSRWTPEETEYIRAKMRRFFMARKRENLRELVGTNIQFDLKVTRGQLDIPFISHKVWDVTAGEMELDENIALFNSLSFRINASNQKTTQGNLRAITTAYGNDWYWRAEFSKGERFTLGRVDIYTHIKAQEYCACDAQIVLAIRTAQIARARHIRLSKTRVFEPYFIIRMTAQMSNTCVLISHAHQHGSHVELSYFDYLSSKESPLLSIMKSTEQELITTPAAQQANARLLAEEGMQKRTLFGGKGVNLMSLTKGNGMQHLFFGVLGLKPLKISKKTGTPAIDKAFLNEYAPLFPEVGLLQQYRIASKLVSTYVKGWASKVRDRIDSAADNCLRPSFGFFIVTGRLNSFDPNLQQAPSRGKIAKYIKEAFRARRGRVNFAWDFNASEVRWACVLAGDTVLRDVFLLGYKLRQALIQSMDPKEREELDKQIKTDGDVHVRGVKLFFNQMVSKSHPLRSAIKTVTFGVLFGKSVKSLAKDIQGEARYRHRDAIIAAENNLRKLKKELTTMPR